MQILSYWKILLELVILWYVIYMILLFVKGTRSEQLLKGLVIVGIIFIMTQQLKLETISWILTRLFPLGVIALIIIFQPELRRGLARLGRFGIYQEDTDIFEEITKAVANLAAKKTGALIVIERESGLKSYIESGIIIDSKVTGYLLTSIFLPQSPLHDGAVIIQHARLVAAGCVLPLTEEDEAFSQSLGMRHRAALGITEETDAVCVVVSEETGSISIATSGKLISGLNEENLIKNLKRLFYRPPARKAPFKIFSSLLPKGKVKDRG